MDTLESFADEQNELGNVVDENQVEVLLDEVENEHQEHVQDGLENVVDDNEVYVPDSITDTPKRSNSNFLIH